MGYTRRLRGQRVALLGNGSGLPQLAVNLLGPDAAVQRAELSIPTQRASASLLEFDARLDNPVITYMSLTAGKVQAVLDILQDDAGAVGARCVGRYALGGATVGAGQNPVVTCFMGDTGMRPLRRMLDDAGTPAFRTPESAADAFGVLATHL